MTMPTNLMKCPDCGALVSRRAMSCPMCGAPLVHPDQRFFQGPGHPAPPRFNPGILFLLGLGAFALVAFALRMAVGGY